MPLTRDQIMAAQDIETVEVDVPSWGGSVLVRGMTAAERGKYMAAMMEQRGKHQIVRVQEAQVRLCAMCMVDAEGKRLFGDGDVPALASKAAAALQPVYEAAARLSGLTDEDVEELTKNSDSQSDDSLSD
jgi:hypothetical protein